MRDGLLTFSQQNSHIQLFLLPTSRSVLQCALSYAKKFQYPDSKCQGAQINGCEAENVVLANQ